MERRFLLRLLLPLHCRWLSLASEESRAQRALSLELVRNIHVRVKWLLLTLVSIVTLHISHLIRHKHVLTCKPPSVVVVVAFRGFHNVYYNKRND